MKSTTMQDKTRQLERTKGNAAPVRRALGLGFCLLALIATAGCVESVHPVHDEQSVVYESALVGKWTHKETTWTFARRDDTSYRLEIVDERGNKMPFVAHLARVDGTTFLDLYPEQESGRQANFHDYHHFPVHSVYLVRNIGDQVQLGVMNLQELGEFLEANPGAVDHVKVDKRWLLTASTDKLQKFFVEHKDQFTGKIDLERN